MRTTKLTPVATMSEEDSATNQLLKQMMEQITQLQAQVKALQQQPADSMETTSEEEATTDGLVDITDATRVFLEAAFSETMDNDDRTAHIR